MHKNAVRILLGIALLAGAWQSYSTSLRSLEKARGLLPEKTSLHNLDPDFFDQRDPRTIPTTPEQLTRYREAYWLQRLALVASVPGTALILLGVLPIVLPQTFRLLAWLFIPDFMRRHRNDAAIEMAPEEAAGETDKPPGSDAVPLVSP